MIKNAIIYDELKSLENTYFPETILKEIKDMSCKNIRFEVKSTFIDLYILSNKSFHITFFVNYIAKCIYIIEKVFNKSLNHINIVLALTHATKTLSKTNKVIKSININSGLSYSYQQSPYIVIYRKEEICKVIIHELLHVYKIHPHMYPQSKNAILIKKHHVNLKGTDSLNIYESYVEAFSLYINAILYDNLFDTDKAFSKEMNHQLYTINQFEQYKPYVETSNVFSYVFLKYSLLVNFEEILSKVKSNDYCIANVNILMRYTNILFEKTNKKIISKITLNKMDIFKNYLKSI
jgi:hypothetical protein